MQAVIIAAGDGGRLYPLTSATPKPLLTLGGRPIIDHVLDALQHAGVDDVVIVVGYRGEQIRGALHERPRAGMCIRFVQNDAYMLGNARSLWSARNALDGHFVLAMADHLIEPEIAAALVKEADGRCRLAIESTHVADVRAHEATRARVRHGRVLDLGKDIIEWNALDTGLFWCTERVFEAMTPDLRDGEAGAIFAKLARAGELDAVDVTGSRWMDIDTPQDLRDAEASLASGALWHNGHARSA